jgi:hypothetical protein
MSRQGVILVTGGRWVITDGVRPGQGKEVGFVRSLPTGMVHLQVDAYFSLESAEFVRLQIMAAINNATALGQRT